MFHEDVYNLLCALLRTNSKIIKFSDNQAVFLMQVVGSKINNIKEIVTIKKIHTVSDPKFTT